MVLNAKGPSYHDADDPSWCAHELNRLGVGSNYKPHKSGRGGERPFGMPAPNTENVKENEHIKGREVTAMFAQKN